MNEKMFLTKESSKSEIQKYFEGVRDLVKSGKDFPVSIDDVWQIAYSEKGKAVRALKANFIEGIDYTVFAQNGKNLKGGRPVAEYMLTAECLEFFVARKVRDVFDVYRQVFHRVADYIEQQPQQLSAAESLLQSVQLLVAHERQLSLLETQQKNMQGAINTLYDEVYGMKFQAELMKQKLNNEIERYTVIGYCSLHKIDITRKEAAIIGGACARMCKKENIPTESIADPRFGKVNTYPSEIIAKCYEERQKKLLEQTV